MKQENNEQKEKILKKLRKEQNKTQQEIAKFLNTDQSNYSKLENKDINSITSGQLKKFSEFYNVSTDYILGIDKEQKKKSVKIAVIGTIPAGIPIEAIEDIIDYEEIPQEMAKNGQYFGLKVKGDSMSPRIQNGDVVIIRQQDDAESGDVCVVMVNGNEATLKQIKKDYNGIVLVPFNTEIYKPTFYSNEDIKKLPVRIIGKVVELRGKF